MHMFVCHAVQNSYTNQIFVYFQVQKRQTFYHVCVCTSFEQLIYAIHMNVWQFPTTHIQTYDNNTIQCKKVNTKNQTNIPTITLRFVNEFQHFQFMVSTEILYTYTREHCGLLHACTCTCIGAFITFCTVPCKNSKIM